MFLHNDKDFRKLRATNALNWDVLHQELHISLFMLGPFPGGGGFVGLQHDGQWGDSDVLCTGSSHGSSANSAVIRYYSLRFSRPMRTETTSHLFE